MPNPTEPGTPTQGLETYKHTIPLHAEQPTSGHFPTPSSTVDDVYSHRATCVNPGAGITGQVDARIEWWNNDPMIPGSTETFGDCHCEGGSARHRGNFQECHPGFFLCPNPYNKISTMLLNLVLPWNWLNQKQIKWQQSRQAINLTNALRPQARAPRGILNVSRAERNNNYTHM